MSRVRKRLEQYKAEIEKTSQYKQGLPGSALDIVNTILADLEEDEKENGWIPVNERVPEESLNSVIGWDEYRKRCVFIQFVDGQFKNCGIEQSFNITAWKPLPEPYREGIEYAAD